MGSPFWLVVAGTGRCGTKYMSEVLRSAGVNCTHQTFFGVWWDGQMTTREGMAQKLKAWMENVWAQDADSSWLAAPFLDLAKQEDLTVVHQVRHPKKVIDSLVKCRVFESEKRYGDFYRFAYEHCPAMREEPSDKERAARFYVDWNNLIEPWADVFWNVEQDPRGLFDRLGIEHEGKALFDDTGYNRRWGHHCDTQPGDLNPRLWGELAEISERYGYAWA